MNQQYQKQGFIILLKTTMPQDEKEIKRHLSLDAIGKTYQHRSCANHHDAG
ncbi:hypothetical protein JCM19240_1074 [Vibrio maritimus]|uniref:Uncharacterized protein n=1 Tax=Vibrio maritimus TaxID=990268 RepID=A0A090T2I1_9VIBR|nr:hypothetical protein JCM19240_1074 [Vibrio maritimus]